MIKISAETALDPQEWGAYVVVKPSHGKRGAYVWVHRTGRVRFKPPADFPEGHLGRLGPMIAQKFIYSGRWPVAYRVVTFFGRAVAAVRYVGRKDLAPLDGPDEFRTTGGGISIVASSKGCAIELTSEADVLDLACRAHAASPKIPSLGIDIVREEGTGYFTSLKSIREGRPGSSPTIAASKCRLSSASTSIPSSTHST